MHDPEALRELKRAYDRGENVMALIRDLEDGETNSVAAIELAYDLQTGSYVKLMERADFRKTKLAFAEELARVISDMSPGSLMEAGVGEAITLAHVCESLTTPRQALGFDISWSRTFAGRAYTRKVGVDTKLFVAELLSIPLADGSVDVVYTAHTIEPNRGREAKVLEELYRVARRFVVLVEPSNELGSEETRRHIERHKYCLDLHKTCLDLGFEVLEHRIFGNSPNPSNEHSLIVIRKGDGVSKAVGPSVAFACPNCGAPLDEVRGHHFCGSEGIIYPTVDGIPCLRRIYGIIGSKFADSRKPHG